MGIMLLDSSPSPHNLPIPQTLFNNSPSMEEWYIMGSSGKYKMTRFFENGQICNTCSCPSYEYCRDTNKTCKHIKNIDKYKIIR